MIEPPEEKLLDKQQLAEMLGVSPRTIEKWIAANGIPFIRLSVGPGPGKLIRFRPSAIRAWLAEKEEPARKDTEN